MGSVYDFENDGWEEISESVEKSLQYEALKNRLGFQWWSLKKQGSAVSVVLDDSSVAADANKLLGQIMKAEREDDLCVTFHGSGKQSLTLGIADFKKDASALSTNLNQTTTHQFCSSFNKLLEDAAADDDDDDDDALLVEETSTVEQGRETLLHRHRNPKLYHLQSSKNNLLRVTSENKIGEFLAPVKALKTAEGDEALRALDPNHLADLHRRMKTDFENGHEISLPPAVGVISDWDNLSEDEIKWQLDEGLLVVNLIDGNHTCQVLRELNESNPEAICFQKRKVTVYKNLDSSMMDMLALLCNEEASNSLKTADLYKVKVMRQHLTYKFNGIFSLEYQNYIYMIFNAICPNNPEEEKLRKKNLQHLLRMSTMAEECWRKVENIISANSNITLSAFRDLGSLCVSQALELLNMLEKKRDKSLKIAKASKKYNRTSRRRTLSLSKNSGSKESGTKCSDSRTEKPSSYEQVKDHVSSSHEMISINTIELKEELLKVKSERINLRQKLESEMEKMKMMSEEKNNLIAESQRLQEFKMEVAKLSEEKTKLLAQVQNFEVLKKRLVLIMNERDVLLQKQKDTMEQLRKCETEVEAVNGTNERLRPKIKELLCPNRDQQKAQIDEPLDAEKQKQQKYSLPFSVMPLECQKTQFDRVIANKRFLEIEDDEPPQNKRSRLRKNTSEYEVGDKAMGLFVNPSTTDKWSKWYPCTIAAKLMNGKMYKVEFADGASQLIKGANLKELKRN